MKALVLTEKNQPLLVREEPDPVAVPGEAIVKVYAAALNHRDLWIRKGQYAGIQYPIIPGSDGAGIVASVGHPEADHWIGKEVIIYPSLHWGNSESHQDPVHFNILGLPDHGTLAQYVKVPVANLAEKPSYLSFEEAAAIPLAGLTAFRALFKRAFLQAGEKILITGIGGGVAQFLLQFALAANAEVYVTSGEGEKIAKAVGAGARYGVNYKDAGWIQQLREKAGPIDVIVDGAAGDSVSHLLDLARPGGRVVFYGATKGPAMQVEMRRIFWKQLNVLGSTMGSPADFRDMLNFLRLHQIKPVVDKIFSYNQGEEALQRMNDGHQFGKIVIRIQ
jgi:zinc-binding alcohol dehydrogenase/oxidoreductase